MTVGVLPISPDIYQLTISSIQGVPEKNAQSSPCNYFDPVVLGLRCLHQSAQQRLLLTVINKNVCLVDKQALLIGRK